MFFRHYLARTFARKGLAAAILAGLCALAFAAEPVCVESEAVCVDTADRVIDGVTVSKPCWRYEKRIRCFAPHADAIACTGPNLPPSCTAGEARCSKEDETMGCLETETPLTCTAPVGSETVTLTDRAAPGTATSDGTTRVGQHRGIAALDPVVEISYSESIEGDAALGEGCRIESERCLDSTPREIAVENWPGHTATATPPCWETEVTVSCPTADGAESCQKLVEAGCTQTGETVCAEEREGVCVRWRQTYRCGNPVTGDGIVTDGPVDEPDGGVETDDSACRKELDEALDALRSVPTIPCTNCGYCLKGCPKQVAIPIIMMLLNLETMTGNAAFSKHNYQWQAEPGKASDCIQCGACERRCPYNLPIREMLKAAAKDFGV